MFPTLPRRVYRDTPPRAGDSFLAHTLKGWCLGHPDRCHCGCSAPQPKSGPLFVMSTAVVWSQHKMSRFALKPTGLILCWWGNAAPPPCDPQMLSKDENTVGNAPCLLVMAGAPSPSPCLLHCWRPGSVCNYPPGIADVLRVVLHCDGQPVLCHPLPVQGAVYVDDAGLPRKKEEIGTRDMRWASPAGEGILWMHSPEQVP